MNKERTSIFSVSTKDAPVLLVIFIPSAFFVVLTIDALRGVKMLFSTWVRGEIEKGRWSRRAMLERIVRDAVEKEVKKEVRRVNDSWETWNERRKRVEAKGEKFSEPPPNGIEKG